MFKVIFCFSLIIVNILCKLKVTRPTTLADKLGGSIGYSLANFGQIPYGHRLYGTLDLANPPEACYPMNSSTTNQFLLVKRGNCTFVTKVRNAQIAGYQFVIIGNNIDEQQTEQFTMADDGTGYTVTIPSVFINSEDYETLATYAQQYQQADPNDGKIFMIIKFDVHKFDYVSVIFGLNVQDGESYKLIREFKEYYQKLNSSITNYTLVYQLYEMYNADSTQEYPNCIANGKYCAFDPDGAAIGTGRDVVEEILRQTCIFEIAPVEWFDYMATFRDDCYGSQTYTGCSQTVQIKLKLPIQKISECYKNSFVDPSTYEPTNNLTNVIVPRLDNQIRINLASGIIGFPTAIVNEQVFKGKINGKAVFGEICNSFLNPPSSCSSEIDGYIQIETEGETQFYIVLIITGLVMLIFLILMMLLIKRLVKNDVEKETPEQMNEMISQYIRFAEGKDKSKSNSV